MGYYTRYELEIFKCEGNNVDEITEQTVDKLDEKNIINYALDENLCTYDEAKWYDHDEDMRKISSEIRDVVYKLHGEGEENGDVWDKYYLNGKSQHCYATMVIEKFDETQLT